MLNFCLNFYRIPADSPLSSSGEQQAQELAVVIFFLLFFAIENQLIAIFLGIKKIADNPHFRVTLHAYAADRQRGR